MLKIGLKYRSGRHLHNTAHMCTLMDATIADTFDIFKYIVVDELILIGLYFQCLSLDIVELQIKFH